MTFYFFFNTVHSNNSNGEIRVNNDEVKYAQFLAFEKYKDLPINEQRAFESLIFFRKNKKVKLS